MIDNRYEEYLASDDIEMVRLGAILLTQLEPKNKWFKILNQFSQTMVEVSWGTDSIFTTTTPILKWRYIITPTSIEIFEPYINAPITLGNITTTTITLGNITTGTINPNLYSGNFTVTTLPKKPTKPRITTKIKNK